MLFMMQSQCVSGVLSFIPIIFYKMRKKENKKFLFKQSQFEHF